MDDSYGFQFSPDTASNYKFDPRGYFSALGSAIKPYLDNVMNGATLATHGPVGRAQDVPTFDGSAYSINPRSGQVKPIAQDVDAHPDAEPPARISSGTAKKIEPYTNRIMDLVEGFGTKHMLMPGSKELHDALGTSSAHLGTTPTRGNPFGRFIEAFSPGVQNTMKIQKGVDEIYTTLLKAKLGEMTSGPNTVGEAHQLGMRPPLNQNQMRPGIMPPGQYGPGAPEANPDAQLTLPQQVGITGPLMKGIASGNLVKDPETGELITSWQASARENPMFLDFNTAQKAIEALPNTPKGFILPTDSKGRVPASVYNAAEQRYSASANQISPDMGNDRESIARTLSKQMTGQDMSYIQAVRSGNKPLIDAINKEYEKLQGTIAGQRSYGGGNAKLDLPLDPKDTAAIFDKEHFDKTGEMKPLAPDMANGSLSDRHARAKGLYIGEKDREQLAGVDQSGSNLDSIFAQAEKLMTAKDEGEALTQAGKIYAAGHPVSRFLLRQVAPEFDSAGAATYLDSLKALSNNLSKAFGGERGVLTNVDVQRWVNAMPRPSDTAEIREKKAVLLKQLYAEAKRAQLRAIRGDMTPKDRLDLGKTLAPMLDKLEKLDTPKDNKPLGKLSPEEKEFAQDAIRKGVPQDELERMLRHKRKQK